MGDDHSAAGRGRKYAGYLRLQAAFYHVCPNLAQAKKQAVNRIFPILTAPPPRTS